MNSFYEPLPDDIDRIEVDIELKSVNIQLTREQGTMLKELIQEFYPHTFPHYCTKTGIRAPNFYNTTNGERPCTLDFLNKILSGIGYEAILANPTVVIQKIDDMVIVPNEEDDPQVLMDEYDDL